MKGVLTVPCRLCSKPTSSTGTKLCDPCWELETRVERDKKLAFKILLASSAPDGEVVQFKELLDTLKEASEHLDYCGYGDKWERECAEAQDLPAKIQKVLSKYGHLL